MQDTVRDRTQGRTPVLAASQDSRGSCRGLLVLGTFWVLGPCWPRRERGARGRAATNPANSPSDPPSLYFMYVMWDVPKWKHQLKRYHHRARRRDSPARPLLPSPAHPSCVVVPQILRHYDAKQPAGAAPVPRRIGILPQAPNPSRCCMGTRAAGPAAAGHSVSGDRQEKGQLVWHADAF